MTTIVIRSRKKKLDLKNPLHQIQRAIDWPDNAVSACREQMYAPWQFTTKPDILQKRQERMEHHLWWKREYKVTRRKALYVWVFWCPGINNFFFRGWWLYLIGRGISYGKYLERDKKTVSRLIELFPLVKPRLFGPPDIDEWKAEFVKQFQRGYWCGKPQGKSPIWAEVEGNSIRRILSRTKWPNNKRPSS